MYEKVLLVNVPVTFWNSLDLTHSIGIRVREHDTDALTRIIVDHGAQFFVICACRQVYRLGKTTLRIADKSLFMRFKAKVSIQGSLKLDYCWRASTVRFLPIAIAVEHINSLAYIVGSCIDLHTLIGHAYLISEAELVVAHKHVAAFVELCKGKSQYASNCGGFFGLPSEEQQVGSRLQYFFLQSHKRL